MPSAGLGLESGTESMRFVSRRGAMVTSPNCYPRPNPQFWEPLERVRPVLSYRVYLGNSPTTYFLGGI
jgi:hypothetical protein